MKSAPDAYLDLYCTIRLIGLKNLPSAMSSLASVSVVLSSTAILSTCSMNEMMSPNLWGGNRICCVLWCPLTVFHYSLWHPMLMCLFVHHLQPHGTCFHFIEVSKTAFSVYLTENQQQFRLSVGYGIAFEMVASDHIYHQWGGIDTTLLVCVMRI